MLHRFVVNALLLSAAVAAAPFPGTILERAEDMFPIYDYVIIGAGTSGMVVANRLTENPKTTVLVIEAGKIDNLEPRMLYPRYVWHAGINNTWPYMSEPMPELNNRTHQIWCAKVLGGGSAINGMVFDRGARGDYDVWGELIGDTNAWSFNSLLPYFKKSETFNPPSQELVDKFGITYDMASHGTSGPTQGSFPPFIYSTSKNFIRAAQQLGIDTPAEGGDGSALGVFWSPNSIDNVLYQRSYPRNTYHILSSPRPNYHVLANTTVTKLTYAPCSRSAHVSGVEYVSSSSTSYATAIKRTVKAKKEVIMASGAINTPRLLQLSGIGSRRLLKSLGIPVVAHLPGVGEGLQDHPVAFLGWNATVPPPPEEDPANLNDPVHDAAMGELYVNNHTGPWTVSTGNVLGFFTAAHINLPASVLDAGEAQSVGAYLRPGLDSTVIAGYEKQKAATLRLFRENKLALVEATYARSSTLDGIMHPLSRGYVQITSNDPLAVPLVDLRALTNPFDWDVMINSVRWQQQVMSQAPALKDDLGAAPVFPDPAADDATLKAALRSSLWPSFAHLSGTCPLMKRKEGGCVDKKLRVYGVRNLRIVDASIMPIIPGTHLQSTVYAVGEKAADIIKGVI
ncbi:hypothetical protein BDZ91DRAFT_651441 [Kalaharituber pfeilii]|nr:hypothetical protein BDZ91DRAFT_651441 [Kalaharituber pfeilii]